MKSISYLDENFKIKTNIDRENLKFYDAESEPFRIYGLLRDKEGFCRVPEEVAEKISPAVLYHGANTAGGRVRFRTNSPYVAISVKMGDIGRMSHFPLTGSAGFDLYTEEGNGSLYRGTFVPPYDMKDGYESIIDFSDGEERVITIHFPLYSDVDKLYIGLDGDSILKPAPSYRYEKPIVFYGNSITQGGCASRPGNSYESIISRRLNVDYINLGFSGGGKAEDSMTRYLADMEMCMFVSDYDGNAPDAEYLRKTHLPLYRAIRAKHPKVPYIMLSAPHILLTPDKYIERREVIRETYQTALSEGDENVYFIDGAELFAGEDWDLCTVDGAHPNDLGFYRIAMRIEKEISKILNEKCLIPNK